MSRCLHCPNKEVNARNLASGKMKARVKILNSVVFTPSSPTSIRISNEITAKAKFSNFGSKTRKRRIKNYTGRILCPQDTFSSSSSATGDTSVEGNYTVQPTVSLLYEGSTSLFGAPSKATPYQSGLNKIEFTSRKAIKVGDYIDVNPEFFNKPRMKILDVVRSASPSAYYRIYRKLYQSESINVTFKDGYQWLGGYGFSNVNSIYESTGASGDPYSHVRVDNTNDGCYASTDETLSLSRNTNSFPSIVRVRNFCYKLYSEGGNGVDGDVDNYIHYDECSVCIDNLPIITTTTIAPTTTTATPTTTAAPSGLLTTTISPFVPQTTTVAPTTTPTPSAVFTTTSAPVTTTSAPITATTTAAPYSPGYGYEIGPIFGDTGEHFGNSNPVNRTFPRYADKKSELTYTVVIDGYALTCVDGNLDFVTQIIDGSYLRASDTVIHGIKYPKTKKTQLKVKTNYIFEAGASQRLASNPKLVTGYVDRFGGHISKLNSFDDFQPVERLYPSGDIITASGGFSFINESGAANDLYRSIDEGVFTGSYTKFGKESFRVTDDLSTYVMPSAILTKGNFKYKLEVTPPSRSMSESFLVLRASAPMQTYTSELPPIYTLSNLRLEDPSGNLITQYKDIVIKGDAKYNTLNYKNFATYFSEPEKNHANLSTNDSTYPIFGEASGYTLNIDVNVGCADDPFADGFSFGFEDTCVPDFLFSNDSSGVNNYLAMAGAAIGSHGDSVPFLGVPTNNLRISAIEILSSGSLFGYKKEIDLGLITEIPTKGLRGVRDIFPVEILSHNYDTTIDPIENTLWSGVNNLTNIEDNKQLTESIRNNENKDYLELLSTSNVADSGKLKLRFSHETPILNLQLADGAFSFGSYKDGLQTANERLVAEVDSFFIVDEIELKIVAKKAAGTRDYVLDVVGYSDDKLLHVTPKIGGFLQNASGLHPSGLGVTPVSSGFGVTDEIGISSEAISDKFQYFESSGTSNAGGDHYSLPIGPVVNSTEFVEYTIPLKIYSDKKPFGKSIDYSMSTYFENIFLDIYPFPSGAMVSHVALSFTYAPSQALSLSTLGHSVNNTTNKSKPKAFPVSSKEFSSNLNASFPISSGLSLIEQIPQGYKTPSSNVTLKTNYSRRWRGVDGNIVNGPFDISSYDYSFYNPELEAPFPSGFYSFNHTQDNFVLSDNLGAKLIGANSGQFNGSLNSSIIDSIGFRFNSSGMFPSTQQRTYKTIDWTPSDHELNGRILDSFDKAIRVSGNLGNLNFGSGIPVSSGFSAYVRFSPDITISGSSYNLWNSGVLLSKWDSGAGLEFALGYSGGFLCGRATAIGGNNIYIQDTQNYTNYQYPLSVLLTYNDSLSSGLKLYVDSEIDSGNHNILRASSTTFAMSGGNSNIVAGYSSGSGVGINAFFTDIGIGCHNASGSNIVESGYLRHMQQTTAQHFFDQHRVKFWNSGELHTNDDYKLWSFVDEDVDKWRIGAFSVCQFNQAYDRLYGRVGNDFINHNLNHDGAGYEQKTNITFPSNIILSGVAYHTQIENDMLRFNIGTIPEDGSAQALYSPAPRIAKEFPRGYKFNERSFVVETILQHFVNKPLIWPDNASGVKLIVSLYAPHKDVVNLTSGNYGLINRHTHYLPQSGCWKKISSTFDYNDWIDKSEPWSKFDKNTAQQKFDHEYYSEDIEKMFIQYDLAYPSGTAFNSNIKLHTINLKMENAVSSGAALNSTNFTLYSSGYIGENIATTLQVLGHDTVSGVFSGSGLSLSFPNVVTNLVSGVDPSGMLLSMPFTYASGPDVTSSGQLGLMTSGDGLIGFNPSLVNYGDGMFGFVNQTGVNPVVNMSIAGKLPEEPDFNAQFSLYVSNDDPYPQAFNQFNFFMPVEGSKRKYSDIFASFFSHGTIPESFDSTSSMPLYVNSPKPKPILEESMGLAISGSFIFPSASGTTHLFTQNYLISIAAQRGKLQSINWTNENTGSGLLVSEEDYAYLEANDEIRGVDITCFGTCDIGDETCIEAPVEVHGETFGGDCVEGGIFRAKRLYTNIATSGFKTDVGYDGNYYGIRKFVGLIPESPYIVNIFGQTGSSERKALPKSASVEYGINGEVNFSGIKIVADGIVGASGVTSLASDLNRDVGDKFGKSVAVKGDYMIVGSPHHNLKDESGYDLGEAGSIFVYKREPEPSGYDWDYHKAGWSLDTKLHLPSGHKRDYKKVTKTQVSEKIGQLPFTINETQWYTGQEGKQLGHSLDMSSSGTNPVIVAGAPNAKWKRTFVEPAVSGVDVALFIFTRKLTGFSETFYNPNETNPSLRTSSVWNIVGEITRNNLLFKYFCKPSIELNAKVIIFEPIADTSILNNPILDTSSEEILFKFPIHNMDGNHGNNPADQEDIILEEIKQIFHGSQSGVYKYDASKKNNGIPAIVGCVVDDSQSMGESRALGKSVERFSEWLEEYSQASGVLDIRDQPRSSYFAKVSDQIGIDWVAQGKQLVTSLLNTGTLFSTNTFELFANNLGTFRSDIDTFNLQPVSGGSVFIFQQEINNGIKEWNTIQEIKSPTAVSNTNPDRFGHAVAISDDAKVIIIGSPYTQNPIQVYSYNEYSNPVNFVGSWLNKVGPEDEPLPGNPNGYIYEKYLRYNELNVNFGSNVANQTVYDELSSSGKFQLVKDENIEQYTLDKSFTYSQFKPQGAKWEWLYSKFVPTSRLGYSVAVNEDGSIFAAGAPTDSILHEEFNDFNLWWRPVDVYGHQWFSSVNAGSVRIFESREYYPHDNKVVEFTKLGNLHRALNFSESPTLFNHMESLYAAGGKTFERLPEDEVDIPNDAGLAFIISPEIDSLSDEILDNIQDWLGLGDRHLVIVGDDPLFEEDGIYATTNEIVNKLLSKLDSRMRIYEASGDYAALIGSNRTDGGVYSKNDVNITPSFVPRGTTSALGHRINLYGSGVGNIKIFDETVSDTYSCEDKKDIFFSPELDAILGDDNLTYSDINENCNIPIRHEGDMRSEWNDFCLDINGRVLIYPVNLALFYGTKTYVGYGCDPSSTPFQDTSRASYEPIPLLTSAEYITKTRFIKAIPDVTEDVLVYHDVLYQAGITFANIAESGAAFYWSSTGNNYNYLQENIQPTFTKSRYDLADHPDIPEYTDINGRTSILRSKAEVDDDVRNEVVDISNYIACAKENYKETTSEIYIIGSTLTEDLNFLNKGTSTAGAFDNNLLFYRNLLHGANKLGQLGGWTGRESFVSAETKSYLDEANASLVLGVTSVEENIQVISDNFDALWIASTHNTIDANGLRQLKNWLAQGNKKLYITIGQGNYFNENISNASQQKEGLRKSRVAAADLCKKLDLNIKPLFLPEKNKYADFKDFRQSTGASTFIVPYNFIVDGNLLGQLIDGSIIEQTRFGRLNENILSFNYQKTEWRASINTMFTEGTPIDTRDGGFSLLYTSESDAGISKIVDDNFVFYGVPHIKTGVAKVNFPVIGGSGYRIFIDTIANSFKQDQRHQFKITNCTRTYGKDTASGVAMYIKDIDNNKGNSTYNSHVKIKNYDIGDRYLQDFVGAILPKNKSKPELIRLGAGPFPIRGGGPYTSAGELMHEHMDIYVPTGIDNISIYIDANTIKDVIDAPFNYISETVDLVGVSGALLDSKDLIGTRKELLRVDQVVIPGQPARTDSESIYRPISTNSLKYCPSTTCLEIFTEKDPQHEIEDGPIVAAQELYHQREFSAGVNRSRITVLSDASMIQGRMIANEELVVHDNVRIFLQSLYPETQFPEAYEGKQYNIISRITSPVKGSPQKFFNSTGNSGNMIRFAGDGTTPTSGRAMTFFSDTLDVNTLDNRGVPLSVMEVRAGKGGRYVVSRDPPYPTNEQVERIRLSIIAGFDAAQYSYGGTSKFSGIVDGELYADAYYGNLPKLLGEKDIDYLDFDKLPSGYPGDLFGYSLSLRDNQLLVGQPFGAFADERAENPITWAYVSGNTAQHTHISGAVIGYGGGAGSAYLYDRGKRVLTDYGVEPQSKPWTLNQKFRPSSINVGQDLCLNKLDERYISTSGFSLGVNNYSITELAEKSFITDQFGLSLELYKDLAAFGAPGHDFGNFEEIIFNNAATSSGAFNLKEFGNSTDIPKRNVYDIGESGVRHEFRNSGVPSVLNAGAAYLYENTITDWDNRVKNWKFNEKLVAKGHNSRKQRSNTGGSNPLAVSGSENDYFGRVISMYQTPRTDSDYAIAFGVPNHQFATSGNHISFNHGSGENAGAVYQYDVILRKPEDSVANTGITLEAKVYGNSGIDRSRDDGEIPYNYIPLNFANSGQYSKIHENSGLIYSNNEGEIFLEVSGQDPSSRGFITHRPFIQQITGKYLFGVPETGLLRFYTAGQGIIDSGSMNLFNAADSGAMVYNNLGLYTSAVLGSVSGAFSGSGLSLFVGNNTSGIFNSGLTLMSSGGPIIDNDNLFLRVRGK